MPTFMTLKAIATLLKVNQRSLNYDCRRIMIEKWKVKELIDLRIEKEARATRSKF
jgi:hypothetical protein